MKSVLGLPLSETPLLGYCADLTAPPTGDANLSSSNLLSATATGSATPNTKGPYTEVIAATTKEIFGLVIASHAVNTALSTTDTSALVDVAIGAAGSEVIVIPNLAMGWRTSTYQTGRYRFPIYIPVGSRIAIRCQGAQASKQVGVRFIPLGRAPGSVRPADSIVSMGWSGTIDAVTGSKGVNLTPAGSTNTKGAWTTLVAATPEPFRGLAVGIQGGADNTQSKAEMLFDLGVGSAGGEVVRVPNMFIQTDNTELINVYDPGAWATPVPADARIAMRYQHDVSGGSLDAIVYGIR